MSNLVSYPARPTQPFIAVRDSIRHAPPMLAGLEHAVVAIGNFDGVHRGHRAVIATALARAAAIGRPAAALTFEPSPRAFFAPERPLFRLSDETNKLRLLAATGLSGAIVMAFEAELAELSADEFVRQVLVERLGIAGAAVGFNFHFGKGRGGSPEFLSSEGGWRGFSVDVVAPVDEGGERVSSDKIRHALSDGHVAQAAQLLGYPWFVSGKVVHGDKRGREFGFPTANIRLDPACALKHGIYAVRVGLGGKRYDGVASFGRRPMFDSGAALLEVFLFDFSGDLYGAVLDVAFMAWIRHELAFDSVNDLIRRMEEDARHARALLERADEAFPPLGAVVSPAG
jgi:riboflavin kinase/FMN adenylyltransferase